MMYRISNHISQLVSAGANGNDGSNESIRSFAVPLFARRLN